MQPRSILATFFFRLTAGDSQSKRSNQDAVSARMMRRETGEFPHPSLRQTTLVTFRLLKSPAQPIQVQARDKTLRLGGEKAVSHVLWFICMEFVYTNHNGNQMFFRPGQLT